MEGRIKCLIEGCCFCELLFVYGKREFDMHDRAKEAKFNCCTRRWIRPSHGTHKRQHIWEWTVAIIPVCDIVEGNFQSRHIVRLVLFTEHSCQARE